MAAIVGVYMLGKRIGLGIGNEWVFMFIQCALIYLLKENKACYK